MQRRGVGEGWKETSGWRFYTQRELVKIGKRMDWRKEMLELSMDKVEDRHGLEEVKEMEGRIEDLKVKEG